jgi:hypothetical protein
MRHLLLAGLAALVCGCSPREVRCDRRLVPINVSVAEPGASPAADAGPAPGVR